MSLSDLPASELARIDAVCLDYEANLRSGQSPDIAELVQRHGGSHAALLQRELELVRDEIQNGSGGEMARTSVDPFRTKIDGELDSDHPLPESDTAIGPFVIRELIGRGGMGVVFSADDQRLGRKVAIKMLAVQAARRKELTERFDREARALASLSHPNIVELFDVGVFNGLPYAVMEYLDGELLSQRLKRSPMAADQVRSLGVQIADALSTAHRAGVVHRDLKPHNIMLLRRSRDETDSHDADTTLVKLFDFGLSRAPNNGFAKPADETAEGIIMGTPGYMAPEQARGEKVTPAADVFSLGCVLFEAFYGRRSFDGRTHARRFAATLRDHPEPDPIRRRDDPALADLIDHCLQKEVARRPASAADIARQLRQPTDVTEMVGGGANRRMWLVAGGLGLAAVASSPWWWTRGGTGSLTGIRSLAVLSLTEAGQVDSPVSDSSQIPEPLDQTPLKPGEQLSALLVHELTRLSDLNVPRFRPLVAETPAQFREIGELLEVDALLTGTIRTVRQGTTEFAEIDLQIVSATTGNQLWGKQLQTDAPDNLLEQSKLVSEIASVIGHRLTSTANESAPPTVESFSCLVDGKTRSDPDSLDGLEMALKCFQKARQVDRRYAEPVAGIALTSITMAGQTGIDKAMELVRQSRESVDEALGLDPHSVDARLASAMLDWQTVGRFDEADRSLRELVMIAPNHWQVRHQYGLLLLTLGRHSEAVESLRQAELLNPMSVIAKVDSARARWYGGNAERAITDATRIRDRFRRNDMARGLLVDLYEHMERYDLAAAEQDGIDVAEITSAQEYFRQREKALDDLPYGPFGQPCNRAILQLRNSRDVDDRTLAAWTDPLPPMFALLLAVHPSFAPLRLLPRAEDILP